MKTPNMEQSKGIATLLIGIVVVVVLIVLGKKLLKGVGGIFEFLDLNDTKEESQNKDFINDRVNAVNNAGNRSEWSPVFWKNSANSMIFTGAKAEELVNRLWDSVGYVWDSPNKAKSAIGECRTKSQVSYLCYKFAEKHKLDLVNWMEEHFDQSEEREVLAGILRYAASLPNYRA